MNELVQSVQRLSKDLRDASGTLSRGEARFFVDYYYQMQEDRIRAAGRIRAMTETEEPHDCVKWLEAQSSILEQQIKGMLDRYTQSQPIGLWLRSIRGIGPVLAAGYMANLDITRRDPDTGDLLCTTAAKFWKICGLAPGFDRRVRGQKLQYNPALKRLAYLTGESFKRLGSEDEDAYYRRWYEHRKTYEIAKNAAGDYREQAELSMTQKKFGEDTIALSWYKQGKLPPGRIDRRAARYATKMMLSHLHQVWWMLAFPGTNQPMPFAIGVLSHDAGSRITPPNLHVVGLAPAPEGAATRLPKTRKRAKRADDESAE